MKKDSIKSITRKIDSISGVTLQGSCHTVQIRLSNGRLSPIYVIGDGVVAGAHARLDGMTLDYMVLNGYILPLVLCLLSLMGVSDQQFSLFIALPNALIMDIDHRSLIKGQLESILLGHHAYLFDGQERQLLVNNVSFSIQGLAALSSRLLDEEGNLAAKPELLNAPLNILDVGLGSANYLRINNTRDVQENGFILWRRMPGNKNLCCWLRDEKNKFLGRTYDTWEDYLPCFSETPITNDSLIGKEDGDVFVGAVKRRWAEEASNMIRPLVPKIGSQFYVTGGGALLLHEEIQKFFPVVEFLPDPINAAAIGSVHFGAARHQNNIVGLDLGAYSVKGASNA